MFGSGGFGSTPSTFGGGGFGTTANTGASVFGQPAQPQQTTSLFGGGTTTFGAQQTLPAFGAGATAAPATAFGAQAQTSSVFGQQARPAAGIFSNTATTISPFATQTQVAGTSIPFNAITGTDTMMKNGAASQINTRHQCITCMKEYENKSLEELRLEDYQLNRKGPQNPMFGGGAPQQAQPGGGIFSGIGATSTAGASTFGQTPAFGQTSTSGGLFGSALNQPKPGGFFGSGATPTSSGFGTGSSLGFSFSNPTSQPQQSIFGANNNTATVSTTGGLGTTSFSFSQPQQQQQLSLFSQKPLATPASSAPAFGTGGFGAAATNTTMSKPIFGGGTGTSTFGTTGTAAPTFGTGTASLFSTNTQQQGQAKPFSFSTPFSSTPQTSQPTFGATSGTSTFNFSNPVSTPTVNFASGTGAAPAFGAGTTTGSSFAPLSFSLGGSTGTQQAGTAPTFGTGFFSSNTNTGTGTTGLSLFNPGGSAGSSFNTGGLQLQQQQMQLQQQQQHQQLTGNITFATTPYKDSQLFYNLISNRKVDDMTKPTNPTAQRQFREASRRKTSTSAGISTSLNLNSNAALKNLTFPTSRNRNSISKFQIFDGFEEEDRSIGVDILSPKTNVKKLILTNTDISTPSTPRGGGGKSLLGMTPLSKSLNSSGFQSPNNGGLNRRNRLTLNSTLNNSDLSYVPGDNGALGESNRTIDFGESSLLSETSRNDYGNGEGNGNGRDSYPNGTNGPYSSPLPSSKRGSEVDVTSPKGIGTGGGGGGSSCEGSPYINGISLNDSIPGQICGVICTRPGYYVKPSVEELDRIMDQNGNCVVNAFEVGRVHFGKIKFILPVNVANLNIDEIVLFRHKEVVVYPDDNNKPPLGQGLNVAAEIELERVWPIDKSTNDAIRSPRKLKTMNYDTKLKRACSRLDADFISYNEEAGIWKFKVNHFSKYSCELEENEDDDTTPPIAPSGAPSGLPQQMGKGLGGTPLSQQHKLSLQQRMSGHHQPGPGGDASSTLGAMKTTLVSPPPPPHFTVLAPPPSSQDARQFQMLEGGPPQSDVELNPLTPCDSDDDDEDDDDDDEDEENLMVRRRPSSMSSRPMLPKYKAVLKDAGTEKSRLMKSIMSIDEFYEEDSSMMESMQAQPPIKKSRANTSLIGFSAQSLVSGGSGGGGEYPEVEYSMVQRLRGRLTADTSQLEQLNKALTGAGSKQSSSTPSTSTKPQQQTIMQVVKPVEFLSLKEKETEDVFKSVRSNQMRNNVKLQGCPRVCFLPNGHFLSINQGVGAKGFSAKLKICQLSSYADKQEHGVLAGPVRAVLETQLGNRLRIEGVLFKEHIDAIRTELPNCIIPQLREKLEEELVFWQLCDILWPEPLDIRESKLDDGFALTQRHNLSNWLRDNAPMLFGDIYEGSDRSVLGLLKKGLVEKACEEAIQQGHCFLAMLIASEPHMILSLQETSVNFLEEFPKSFTDIFTLISGSVASFSELTPERVSSMSSSDWFQYFALYLWYNGHEGCSLPVPVHKAVREYEDMMRQIVEDENCSLPASQPSTMANLCMHLLKMYSCPGYPISLIYCPRTWTKDCLDYKLVWLLMRDLEGIYGQQKKELYSELCLSFAGQLEAIGLWKWAHFVIREIEPGKEIENDEEACERLIQQRDVFTVRLIERNIDKLEGSMGRETERFLIYDLGTDEKLLYSIKSWKTERIDEKIFYFGRMEKWEESLNTLINYLSEAKNGLALISEKSDSEYAGNMLHHLELLRRNCQHLPVWDVHGKMLLNYLTMFRVEEDESDKLEKAVTSFLESVTKPRPSKPSQCAFILEMALSAQKVVQLLFLQSSVKNKETLFDRLQQFLQIPVPKEYFEGLRCFINQNMTFMVDMLNPLDETLPFQLRSLLDSPRN